MTGTPESWFDGAERVLFVHAHPDDETITTGGTLAALAAAGREPMVVTLSRGEQGEVASPPLAHLRGTDGLGPYRETELNAALGMLGVRLHAFLGEPPARANGRPGRSYADSGMQWGEGGRAEPAPDAGPAAATRAPAAELIGDLLAAAVVSGADAIVSYDDGGGYGHPDHVLAHRLARAAALGLEVPFWEIVPVSVPEEPGSEAVGPDPEPAPADAGPAEADTSENRESHDVTPWLERKTAALRAHATQLTVVPGPDGEEIMHVGGQRQTIDRVEMFRRCEAPVDPA